jgi:formylglycine-generating enzyme required for sulfatase activity/serine/threonine protein kinase
MHRPHALLLFAAKAVLKVLGDVIADHGVVLSLPDIARELWNGWSQERDEDQRREELRALARTVPDKVRQLVDELVQELAADKSEAVRQALATYLIWVPPTIRQSLEPVERMAATTFTHQEVVLQQPEDLLRFLPRRMPRFKLGDRPLPGVDLELEELLGVGGFGEVWKAKNPHFDGVAPVALKFCIDRTCRDRLLRHEATVLNQVMKHGKHPGIVPLVRTYLNMDPPCLEYEYVEGGNLAQVLHKWPRREGAVALAAKVIGSVAEVVAYAHRLEPPIVHRDLKPANILVQRSPTGKIVFRIADFGIGGLAATQALEETTHFGAEQVEFLTTAMRGAFTPLYASPQQMRGEAPDPRDDVYSLGVIWYQLLIADLSAGRPGGRHWTRRLTDLGVPAKVIELLGSCFEDNPADRPADAAVLTEQLAVLLKENYPAAPPGNGPAPVPGPKPPVKKTVPAPAGATEDDLAVQVQRALQQVAKANDRARQLLERQHDYVAAIEVLEGVPDHLRDGSLYELALRRRDRAAQLDREIQEAVRSSRFFGLGVKVSALLELQPQRQDLRRLLEVLATEVELPPAVTNSVGLKLSLVPAGSFVMGSDPYELERSEREGPQHPVSITRPFYLGVHPVTQRQYEAVMGENPAWFTASNGGGPDHPVECVSWDDAVEFCRRLTEFPAEREAGRFYRLPTEAEWEYACRAGTTTPFYFGEALSGSQANFNGAYPYGGAPRRPCLERTSPVGSYAPNAFGLCDMHGNVWEWCADLFNPTYYEQSPHNNPLCQEGGTNRVLRGGSWYATGRNCRSACRNRATPDKRVNYVGFRVLVVAGSKTSG